MLPMEVDMGTAAFLISYNTQKSLFLQAEMNMNLSF